jgi:carbon monoxide dehydrogenase subunit G
MTSRNANWGTRLNKKPAGTTIELDDTLIVPVTAGEAWRRLEDIPFVASCLPGLDQSTLHAESDTVYRARMVNTVMGLSANWDLKATIALDPTRRHLTVALEGDDAKLRMKLNGTAEVTVLDRTGAEATLDYVANLRIDGSLAAMGGPVIRSIVADSIDQFVAKIGNVAPVAREAWHRRLKHWLPTVWQRFTKRTKEARP